MSNLRLQESTPHLSNDLKEASPCGHLNQYVQKKKTNSMLDETISALRKSSIFEVNKYTRKTNLPNISISNPSRIKYRPSPVTGQDFNLKISQNNSSFSTDRLSNILMKYINRRTKTLKSKQKSLAQIQKDDLPVNIMKKNLTGKNKLVNSAFKRKFRILKSINGGVSIPKISQNNKKVKLDVYPELAKDELILIKKSINTNLGPNLLSLKEELGPYTTSHNQVYKANNILTDTRNTEIESNYLKKKLREKIFFLKLYKKQMNNKFAIELFSNPLCKLKNILE